MESSKRIKDLTKTIYDSRLRMLTNHPFFGMLALNMKYSLDTKIRSFTTDGTYITFNPNFLEQLNSEEVDICVLHCIMHTILKHPFKENEFPNKEIYNLACDIVVNSNILYSLELIDKKELLVLGQILPHKVNNKEGYLYTTGEVYDYLIKNLENKPNYSSKPIMSIETNYEGSLYTKLESYIEYDKNGTWAKRTSTIDSFDKDAALLTLDKIKQIKGSNLFKIKNITNNYALPYPCYLDGYKIVKDVEKENTHIFYFEEFSNELYSKLKTKKYSDKSIENFEKKYSIEAKKYYLNVPLELRQYLENLIKINNFNKNDENIILKVKNYIKSSARYDYKFVKCPKDKDFVINFLETKIGICIHFATAAVMLYRTLGIPSRYTVGYLNETKKNKINNVYEEDCHAYVEVYLDGIGWVIVDPTASINNKDGDKQSEGEDGGSLDSHQKWKEDNSLREREINNKIMEADELAKNRLQGKVPGFVSVTIHELVNPKIDWRVYLNSFINEVIVDYSFCPPDKRFTDSDFLLPSFSEPDEEVKNILFMVDVSGSMKTEEIVQCFSEIQSAIVQFNGKIEGYIGFFDDDVKTVVKFDGDTDVRTIKPYGRGGTNFHSIFKYIQEKMVDNLPASIIILTDGEARFPDQSKSLGIPVLWVINNETVTPPWGNITRML